MTDIEAKVVAAWKMAVADLGFRFTSPFTVAAPDGRLFEYLGLIHRFGNRVGTLISVIDEPSDKVRHPNLRNEGYFRSSLGSAYGQYSRQLFIDTLDDWRFFGPESERPDWYSGKSWSA